MAARLAGGGGTVVAGQIGRGTRGARASAGGEISGVSASVRTGVAGRKVDGHFVATVEFENGVAGTLEASRLARGRINSNAFEVNGTKGAATFEDGYRCDEVVEAILRSSESGRREEVRSR